VEWQVQKVMRPATGKRILLVEDEEQVRVLMQHVLLSAGYTVDSVSSVAAAIEKIESHWYHLVMTDDRLPDGRGIAIADIARERGMDAVVVTGYMLQAAKADLDRHDYLMKPLRPEELVAAADERLARSEC
jgi:DNA-binding NtrC family response regulator